MWIFHPLFFVSVVRKPGDDHLCLRGRVRADLDELRRLYLPTMTATTESEGTDYRYRATASPGDVANAITAIIHDLAWSNFKSEVLRTQGIEREQLYSRVWSVLHDGLPQIDTREHGSSKRIVFDDGTVLEPYGIDIKCNTHTSPSSMDHASDIRVPTTARRKQRGPSEAGAPTTTTRVVTRPRKLRSKPRRTRRGSHRGAPGVGELLRA